MKKSGLTPAQSAMLAKAKAVMIESHPVPEALIIDDKLGDWLDAVSQQAWSVANIEQYDPGCEYDCRLNVDEIAHELCELYKNFATADLQYHLYNLHYQRPSEVRQSIGESIIRYVFVVYMKKVKEMTKKFDYVPYDYKQEKFKETIAEYIDQNITNT